MQIESLPLLKQLKQGQIALLIFILSSQADISDNIGSLILRQRIRLKYKNLLNSIGIEIENIDKSELLQKLQNIEKEIELMISNIDAEIKKRKES